MENTSSPVRLTYADLCRLPDDGLRHELIDGEHYMTPAPTHGHQSAPPRVVGPFPREPTHYPLGDTTVPETLQR